MRIGILGEIGSGNLGDDLGYQIAKSILCRKFKNKNVDIIIDHISPRCDWSYDAYVTACGTLLDEASGSYVSFLKSKQKSGVPTAVLGSGISDPNHIIPKKTGKEDLKHVLKHAKYAWVRGINGPDFMWVHGYVDTDQSKHRYRGFNFGHGAYTNISESLIHDKIRNHMSDESVAVVCWDRDNDVTPNGFNTYYIDGSINGISQLLSLKSLVSFRGHLSILAACCGVDVRPIAWSTKITDMFRDVIDAPFLYTNQEWDIHYRDVDYKGQINRARDVVDGHLDQFVETLLD